MAVFNIIVISFQLFVDFFSFPPLYFPFWKKFLLVCCYFVLVVCFFASFVVAFFVCFFLGGRQFISVFIYLCIHLYIYFVAGGFCCNKFHLPENDQHAHKVEPDSSCCFYLGGTKQYANEAILTCPLVLVQPNYLY